LHTPTIFFAELNTNVKKKGKFINIVLIYALFTMLAKTGFSETTESLICEKLTSFYGLWKDAAFGKDPNRTEKAAWIILDSKGSYSFQRWPCSAARNKETWKGRVPVHAIALVHTHSIIVDEKPSRQDGRIAQKLRMTLYVISSKGIWSVAPNGLIEKQAGPDWNENHYPFSCTFYHQSSILYPDF
jgi:hypothetical protein